MTSTSQSGSGVFGLHGVQKPPGSSRPDQISPRMVLLARFVSTDWFNPALVGCVAVSFFQKSQLEDFIRTETTRAGQVWGRGCELLRPSGGGQEGCAERAQRARHTLQNISIGRNEKWHRLFRADLECSSCTGSRNVQDRAVPIKSRQEWRFQPDL